MADQNPGNGAAYPNHNLTVKTFPMTTIHPNEIEANNNKYYGGIALALLGVPYVQAYVGVRTALATVIGLLGVKIAVESKGQDPYVAYPFRFQVTEFKYLLKKPTMTNAGFAIYRVHDTIKGTNIQIKQIPIAKVAA